ncbi:MAG: hypothetical protein K5746_03230 [Clostridiales bacterium]|nr:hypothetical protein [Clostridiales bacterium]
MGFMDKLRAGLARFMQGRYGADQLNLALSVVAVAGSLLGGLLGMRIIVLLTDALLIVVFFRMLSRDLGKRAAENAKYLEKTAGIRKSAREFVNRFKNRKQFRYYTCPKCHARLRIPRGVGKVTITCRSCGEKFEKTA